MRIGIDATCWANERGYGRYTRELVAAMVSLAPTHEFLCFLDPRSADRFALDAENVRRVVVRQIAAPTLAARSGSRRSVHDMLRLTFAVREAELDAFLSPTVYGYFPLPPGLPAVVAIHDALVERFPDLTMATRRDRAFWRLKTFLALRQARLVLTLSDYAASEIVRHLHVSAERLRISLVGVADAFRPAEDPSAVSAAAGRAGVPPGAAWILYVGGFGPHKHVDLLVRAHARVARALGRRAPVLVLVGAEGDGFYETAGSVRATIRECDTESIVRLTGFLPDSELRWLYAGALLLALPSASEGLGLPAVEAARCGTPVVATTESPLPQLLEGGGLFVQPGNDGALEHAIEQLVADEPARRAMGRVALIRAQALTWTRSARVALDALDEVVTR